MNEIEELAAQEAAAEAKAAPEAPQEPAPEAPEPTVDTAALEADARRLGWKPREEWKGDATNWSDAATFMDHAAQTPATVKRLVAKMEAQEKEFADRFKRVERFAEEAAKRLREQHAAELEAVRQQQRDAVTIADTQAYDAARKREQSLMATAPEPVAQVAPTPPEITMWLDSNAGVRDNPMLRGMLPALGEEAAKLGVYGVQPQLDYAERRLKALYPEMFKPAATARTVSAVDGGGIATARRGKGWSDIPAAEREMIKSFQIGPGAPFKDEAEAAKAYWEEA